MRHRTLVTGLGLLAVLTGCGATQAAPAPPTSAVSPQFTCIVVANTAATNFTGMPQIMTAQAGVTIPADDQATDISNIGVIYYDAAGNELGSATLDGVGYVTAGQTVYTSMDASQDAPAGTAACQVGQYG